MNFSVEIVAAIGLIIALIVYIVELNASNKANKETIRRNQSEFEARLETSDEKIKALETKLERLDTKVVEELTDIKITLAKIAGKMGLET